MKICTVVGARPQFVKAAAVSRELRKLHEEILVHTGQHYDKNMSDVFFDELDIPKPDYNLGIGSQSHARQTAGIMIGVEDILLKEKPQAVLLYGDTNSTAAAAIAAGKLGIPIGHVEAGVRSFIKDMPEEQNRIIADHLSTWNFAPSQAAAGYLAAEGITQNVYNVGDVMFDALKFYSRQCEGHDRGYFMNRLNYLNPEKPLPDGDWYLATIHRPENTDDPARFNEIMKGLAALDLPVLFPAHPRTAGLASEFCARNHAENIYLAEPLGYIDMIYFAKNARKIITDSGGLHKEAFWLKVPGVVILRGTAWEETLGGNCNILARPDHSDIMEKVLGTRIDRACFDKAYYGDGAAAKSIAQILRDAT